MQSRSKHSTNSSPSPSPSPKRPASPTSKPDAQADTNTDSAAHNSAPTTGNQGTCLSTKRTLRIRMQAAKPTDASPDQDLNVPIRELIALGSGQGGSATKDVDESVRAGRSNKIKLHLKRKPSESSTTSPRSPICLFCLRRFSTRTNLLDHLQMEHSSSEEQVHDQTPDHEQGEDNGGGDSGSEKKSEEEEGSSAATDQGNDGLDLNQPIDVGVQVSAEESEEKVTCGDETIDGPRKKIRFDLNEHPPEEEHEN